MPVTTTCARQSANSLLFPCLQLALGNDANTNAAVFAPFKKALPRDHKKLAFCASPGEKSTIEQRILSPGRARCINVGDGLDCAVSAGAVNARAM